MHELEAVPPKTIDAVEHIGDRAVNIVVTMDPELAAPTAGIEDAIIVDEGKPESDWLIDAPAAPEQPATHEQTLLPEASSDEEVKKEEERKQAEMKEAQFILERVVAAGKDTKNNLMYPDLNLENTLESIRKGDTRALKDLTIMMRKVRQWRTEAAETGKPFSPQTAVSQYRDLYYAYEKEIQDYELAKFKHGQAVGLHEMLPTRYPAPGAFQVEAPKKRNVQQRYYLLDSFVRATRGKLPF